MQGGVIGGVCLLAFLLSVGQTEELEGLKEDDRKDIGGDIKDAKEVVDLKELSKSEVPDDLRSGSSMNQAAAVSYSGAPPSTYSDSYASSSQSRAGGGLPLSPFNPELSPYISSASGLSQAEAQAISDTGSSYGQGLTSYPYSPTYPYSSGSSPAQTQPESDSGFYQPGPIAPPFSSPYNQGLNSVQTQPLTNERFYQPVLRQTPSPILNSYNQGLSSPPAQVQADNGLYQSGGPRIIESPSPYNQGLGPAQADRESYQPINESISLAQITPRFRQVSNSLSDSPSYPYISQTSIQANEQYQPIPLPTPSISSYERFMVPYKESSSTQIRVDNGAYQPFPLANSKENSFLSSSAYNRKLKSGILVQDERSVAYQPVPIPDRNPIPYDTVLVPYKEPSSANPQGNYERYQPDPLPKPRLKQYEVIASLYNRESLAPVNPSSYYYSNRQSENDTYQSISKLVSSPHLVPYREPDTILVQNQTENNASQSNPLTYDPISPSNNPNNSLRSGDNSPNLDSDFDPNLLSKSGWDSNTYNPYQPSGPNPKLYPSGADAAQVYADAKTGATGVLNPYSQGLSPYAIDYPSESPFRPGGFNPNEAPGPYNLFTSGQTVPIVIEDAKSRLILPYEYVFPNKMPGGDNVIQCTKENEFHHFWSRGLDCLVCICLNEYGLLTPVCASCGGCDSLPPKLPESFPRLPESIPVRPATPFEPEQGLFEPVPVVPEPFSPVPQPILPEPVPELYQPIPSVEPNPLYPETIPASPVPVPYPQPIPTLPPPPPEAMCNPLPSGQPFPNPLHPCQICICRESYVSGKTDVQIDCKENPQCIAPADITTLPPLPDVPVPIPLPICEKFPEHVLFPHPTDTCKLCKCSKSLSEAGIPEQHITCYPHPDCVPKVEPITEPGELVPPPLPIPIEPYQVKPYPEPEPTPIVPVREPFLPMEPVPLPEIVTVEPLPWPPITSIALSPTTIPTPVLTPRPGPLPGPSPHESCRPYPPNQTFQHPWDECQLCQCTEAFAVGLITVEVNCYTKPSCCIEPPDELKPAIPGTQPAFGYGKPYLGTINTVNSPDIPPLARGPQPGIAMTSSYRPPPIFSSYSPRSVNIYDPGSNPSSNVDTIPQPQISPAGPYNRLPIDDTFANLPSKTYLYQPNYQSPYVNPQYSPEYAPRLPASTNTIGSYKPSSYGYPVAYQYGQDEPIANAYPGTQGPYPPYDPRYPGASSPNAHPGMYQRVNYEMPPMYAPGQIRDGYGQLPTPALPGSNVPSLPQSYSGNRGSKSGNDGPEDLDES